jgi:signal transduction histidine kinase
MSEDIAEVLGRKYRFALTVAAILVLGNQALLQPYLLRLTIDAPLINVAGRQRMLSQRLAKAALALAAERDAQARSYLEEMRDVLWVWTAANEELLRGSSRTLWYQSGSKGVREGLESLQPQFSRMRDAARRMIQAAQGRDYKDSAVRTELALIIENEPEYLTRMEQVVAIIENEARGRVERLRRLSWLVAGLTLGVLAAIGRFILRPATSLIRRQVSELRRARDDLEARVRERTQEVERATERHRTLLEEFSHVGRTTLIGEMASALAHELNQPLGAIANYAEGCLIELQAPDPSLHDIREALDRLLAATMRSGRIIQQVRRFVTRHGPAPELFDPNAAVSEALQILGSQTEEQGIAITCELASGLPSLRGDSIQIQQVLVNLVTNALDSLSAAQTQNPELVISTRLASRDTVEFAVSDNGEGIPVDRLDRIFDAYFSTRAGGMGMGLAISRTIVEAHNGRFIVDSDPGVRTTFRFQLPASPTDHE